MLLTPGTRLGPYTIEALIGSGGMGEVYKAHDERRCSIDALVRRMDRLGSALGVDLVEHGPVAYRDGGEIRHVPRDRFAALAASGSVTLDTIVFDNTITRVGDVRSGRWERPAAGAWHEPLSSTSACEERP